MGNRKLTMSPVMLEAQRTRAITHGEVVGGKATPEYSAWRTMLARCRNTNNPRYSEYGGRGIVVCERWLTFDNFLVDMGRRPSPCHSLDRFPNNDGGYEPRNCRWALPKDQMRNQRHTKYVVYRGERIPVATLAERAGIPNNTLRMRLQANWDTERAVNTPIRSKLSNGSGRARDVGKDRQ
jgi:hypothetical protein